MQDYREGVDRWRSRSRPILQSRPTRRHPTLRAWIVIIGCLAVLAVAGILALQAVILTTLGS